MKRGPTLALIAVSTLAFGALLPSHIQATPAIAADHISAPQPAQDPALRFAEDLAGRTVAVLDANRTAPAALRHGALKGLVRDGFDLATIGRFVLGRHWREADAAQRAEFQDLFAEHLLDSYARRLDSFRTETVAIVGSRKVGESDTLVETQVDTNSGPTTIAWRVRVSEMQPGIVDVEINGISLALSQRQEFGSLAKRAGIEGLLETLRDRAAARSATLATAQAADGIALIRDGQARPGASAKARMLFSMVGSSGLPWQVALIGR